MTAAREVAVVMQKNTWWHFTVQGVRTNVGAAFTAAPEEDTISALAKRAAALICNTIDPLDGMEYDDASSPDEPQLFLFTSIGMETILVDGAGKNFTVGELGSGRVVFCGSVVYSGTCCRLGA